MATKALGYLEDLANVRLAAHERVCKLHGKLEMLLAQVRGGVTVVTATTGEWLSSCKSLCPFSIAAASVLFASVCFVCFFCFVCFCVFCVFCMSTLADVSATELQLLL